MPQKDALNSLMETLVVENNGDRDKAVIGFHAKVEEMIETQGVTMENISIRNLAEALVGDRLPTDAQELAETLTAAGAPVLTGKLLHPVFIKAYEYMANTMLPLVTEVSSSKSTETIPGMTAHDQLQLTREATPFQHSQPTEKSVEISNHKFGLIIDITKEAVIEDQTGLMVERARDVGKKGGTHLHSFILQKAIDGAVTVTGESANSSLKINGTLRAMFAATHTWDSDFANDNLETVALSATSLNTNTAKFADMKDTKGDPIIIMPQILLVPPILKVTAMTLMGSTVLPGGTNAEPNPWEAAYSVLSSPYLTNAKDWWLGDFASQTRLQWYSKPATETMGANSQMAFNSDIVSQVKFSYHAGVGCTDYRYAIFNDVA